MSVLHIMFGSTAAAELRKAIRDHGRWPDEEVVYLDEDLSFGPIDGDMTARDRWVDDVLGIRDWQSADALTNFSEKAWPDDVMPVAWFSSRIAGEYTAFLWWLSRLGDAPCKIIDVTDHRIISEQNPNGWRPIRAGEMTSKQVYQLIDCGTPLEQANRERYLAIWRRLVAENAPLRILDADLSLVSAPISYLDPVLLKFATAEWKVMAWIIGSAMADPMDDDIIQTGDFFLAARARELAKSGALEWRGDLSDIRKCEVRLPNRD